MVLRQDKGGKKWRDKRWKEQSEEAKGARDLPEQWDKSVKPV